MSKYSWGVDGYGYRHVYNTECDSMLVIASCKGHPASLIEQLEKQDEKETQRTTKGDILPPTERVDA